MKKNNWITPEQELLLKASLCEREDAIQAWSKWRLKVDFEKIDPGSYRLLPLLYSNLSHYEIKDPLMERLKGIYRRTWYENNLLAHLVFNLLNDFHNANIKTMLLKGIAMIHLFYKDYALRPMTDFDIMVPTEQASEAIKLLKKLGWTSANKNPEKIIPYIHSCEFTDPSGLYRIDLHWHLLMECCQPNADYDFWNDSLLTEIKGKNIHILNPTDQLFHTCIHGMKWCIIPPFRWVADAMMIIKKSGKEIDWNEMIERAESRHLILPLYESLKYLKNNFNAEIPLEILNTLQKFPISKKERWEFNYKIENHKKKILGNIPVFWFDYSRSNSAISFKKKISGFLKYIAGFWNLDNAWQLPLYSLSLSLLKIRILTRDLIGKKIIYLRDL